MLRVVSLNLNGVRAAFRKGLGEWLAAHQPDIVCVQELKAQAPNMTEALSHPAGLRGYFAFAKRPGYSGVGIYTRHQPQRIHSAFGDEQLDAEGRFLRLDFADYSVISLYLPSGSSGDVRQAVKYDMMDTVYERFAEYQEEAKRSGRGFLLCGDFNIAHTQKDIRNWRSNQKSSGFLPVERQWFNRLLEEQHWVDVFRRCNDSEGEYTWWSNRARAWDNNVGWRIDYQLATDSLAQAAAAVSIYKASRFSDHAPLIIDYESIA